MTDRFEHIPALDGIRGIALLLVVFGHTNPQPFPGGRIGVDLFFVLSGFLITSILLKEFRQRGTISIGHFYARRFLRLMPASLSVVLFSTLYAYFAEDGEKFTRTFWDASAVVGYVWNWRLVWVGQSYADHQHMFMHFWSLSVEEQFYFFWPVLLLTLLIRGTSRTMMFALFAIGIVGPEIARLVAWKGGPSLHLYFNGYLRSDSLVWGAFTAWLVHEGFRPAERWTRLSLYWAGPISIVGLIWLARYDFLTDGSLYIWGFSLVGLMSAGAIASGFLFPAASLTALLEMPWLRYIGKISYGLYLWHIPFFVIAGALQVEPTTRTILMLFSTFSVAAVSYRYFESPILRYKNRVGYRQTIEDRAIPSQLQVRNI